MKRSCMVMLALGALACGGGETTSTVSDAKAAAVEGYESVKPEGAAVDRTDMPSEDVCRIMKSGVLDGVADVAADSWSYRPASEFVPQALCTATGRARDGSSYEVSLTIMRDKFDSPAAAVASLESTVRSLSEGITIEVAGKTHTKQVEFEPFLEGVGDKAAWAPKLSELSVADGATRFAVAVHGAGGDPQNKEVAIELARRIGDAL